MELILDSCTTFVLFMDSVFQLTCTSSSPIVQLRSVPCMNEVHGHHILYTKFSISCSQCNQLESLYWDITGANLLHARVLAAYTHVRGHGCRANELHTCTCTCCPLLKRHQNVVHPYSSIYDLIINGYEPRHHIYLYFTYVKIKSIFYPCNMTSKCTAPCTYLLGRQNCVTYMYSGIHEALHV